MKERPILFSGPMVRALLAGTKTQTRRVCKPQPIANAEFVGGHYLPGGKRNPGQEISVEAPYVHIACPYGQPGDRLVVRESFRFPASLDKFSPSVVGEKALAAGYRSAWAPTQYEADGSRTGQWRGFDTPPMETVPGKLRPGIHMPRWASRILLEITDVRVERLQDISKADAIAEGLTQTASGSWLPGPCDHPEWAYHQLWDQINGAGSWDANPWVWAISFRRLP